MIKTITEMAYTLLQLFSILIFLPVSALAQTNGRIAVGSSLTARNNATRWLSLSGDFAFGFQQIQGNDHFLLSIWYDKIPGKNIIWFANDPGLVAAPAPRGSEVVLTADRGLVLTDPQGTQLWRSQPVNNQVAYGVMNDTGSFELVRIGDSVRIWSSFESPTDTMVPGQRMEAGGVFYSRMTEENFTRGRFSMRLLPDGNFVLNTRELVTNLQYAVYFISYTYDPSNSSNSGFQVIFNDTGYFFVLRRNGQIFMLTTPMQLRVEDNYLRVTLDIDGDVVLYHHPRTFTGNPGWTAVWWLPENICTSASPHTGRGACGYNNVCRLSEDHRPICECPQGYSLIDLNDTYGNCKPLFSPSCDEDVPSSSVESLYDAVELIDTDWPTSDYEQLDPITEAGCKSSCLTDCFCAVAIYQGSSCWKKKLPLLNGRNDPSFNGKAFLKYRIGDPSPGMPSPPAPGTNPRQPDLGQKKDRGSLVLVTSVLLGGSVFVNFILIFASYFGFLSFYQKKFVKPPFIVETNLRCFSYKELVEATNGFKEELGRGAFGIVYKGVISMTTSTNIIAVKKLDKVVQNGEKEFKTEVDVIAQTHQKNLVRLLGFCDEGEHRLLVYEYMSNGTLASFLFADNKPSWRQRIHIALGIARGLSYLHEECSSQIIHCDIKPQNILLDENYNARVSDFGLAKLLKINQSQTNTAIRGTKGYVAPEWFRNTPVTIKVDVYSFGVLLLEIISCRRSVENIEIGEEKAILTDWVWDCFENRNLEKVVENDLEALSDRQKLEMLVKVGLWCILEDPYLRPTMRKVTQMLEGVIQVTEPPSSSPFSVSG